MGPAHRVVLRIVAEYIVVGSRSESRGGDFSRLVFKHCGIGDYIVFYGDGIHCQGLYCGAYDLGIHCGAVKAVVALFFSQSTYQRQYGAAVIGYNKGSLNGVLSR